LNAPARGEKNVFSVAADEINSRAKWTQFGHHAGQLALRVNRANLENECCTGAFLRGAFLSSGRVYFPDCKHFRTNELRITEASLNNSFSLLDNYAFSTSERWLQAHAGYSSMYLFLKNLPFLQNYLFSETLHARLLWTPVKDYIEAGYSVGLGDIGWIGIFVGFDSRTYDGVGFTVSLPLLRLK
jgi:hypothetical protein